jgi:nitrogen fixation NifU-like protein
MLRSSIKALSRPLVRSPTLLPSVSYHSRIIELNVDPKHVGSFDAKDPRVGTAFVGSPACGDVVKLQLLVENGVVVDAVFKTFGCGSAIASSSLAASWAIGKTLDEIEKITNRDIAKYLHLPPVKLHCSMLAEDALKRAVKDYRNKTQSQPQQTQS